MKDFQGKLCTAERIRHSLLRGPSRNYMLGLWIRRAHPSCMFGTGTLEGGTLESGPTSGALSGVPGRPGTLERGRKFLRSRVAPIRDPLKTMSPYWRRADTENFSALLKGPRPAWDP